MPYVYDSASQTLRPDRLPRRRSTGFDALPAGLAAVGLGLGIAGLAKRDAAGLVIALAGGGLVWGGLRQMGAFDGNLTQRLLGLADTHTDKVRGSVTIDQPPAEVYARWRDFRTLPQIIRHVESVEPLGDDLYRWTARVPGADETVTWRATMLDDEPGRRIVWRSVPGSELHNEGAIVFGEVAGRPEATEVRATVVYRVPGGAVGAAVANFIDALPAQLIKENLRDFKHIAEAGELPTIEGQPSGCQNSERSLHLL